MFILTGDQIPKSDWRSIVAPCFIFVLSHLYSASFNQQFLRPDDFPGLWCQYGGNCMK